MNKNKKEGRDQFVARGKELINITKLKWLRNFIPAYYAMGKYASCVWKKGRLLTGCDNEY